MPRAPAPPPSPPKRMTRSRAKAVEEKQHTQVVTTAGAKAAAPKTKKQTTRAKDAPAAKSDEDELAEPAKSQSKRTARGTAQKANTALKTEADEPANAASKAKGRSRATSVKKDSKNSVPPTAPQVAKRTTRGAAANENTILAAPAKSGPKKKVTFQDEQDAEKENIIILDSTSKDQKRTVSEKSIATASQTARKGRAPVPKPVKKDTVQRQIPLSPKKPTQIAKGQTGNDYTKEAPVQPQSPGKLLSQSQKHVPTPKRPTVGVQQHLSTSQQPPDSPVDELQLPGSGSPVKAATSALSGSPPKRPPPSPFKTSMRDSPKKLNLGTPSHRPNSSDNRNLETRFNLSQTPARRPPSPVKLFQDASSQKNLQTPGKPSLLQTPAKRPPSAIKSFNFDTRTPHDLGETPSLKPTVSVIRQSPQKFALPSLPSPPKLTKEEPTSAPAPKTFFSTGGGQEDILMKELADTPTPLTPTAQLASHVVESTTATPEPFQKSPASSQAAQDFEQSPPPDEATSMDEYLSGQGVTLGVFTDSPMPPSAQETPAPNPSAAFKLRSPSDKWSPGNESEDELMCDDPKYDASPSRKARGVFATPAPPSQAPNSSLSMTNLAERFQGWSRATPDTRVLEQRQMDGFIFSPVKLQQPVPATSLLPEVAQSPETETHNFSDAIQIHEDDTEMSMTESQDMENILRQSKISEASQEYADENEPQVDPELAAEPPRTQEVYTPQRLEKQEQRVLHTVSKVPLKPAGDVNVSPDAKANIKKRRSAANALTPRTDLELQALRQIYPRATEASLFARSTDSGITNVSNDDHPYDQLTAAKGSPTLSLIASPTGSPQTSANSKLLDSAVVFVDVHTSEGADASGIFVDLLQQMGATVRSTWNWNPSPFEDDTSEALEPKVGITHVVFKDGGKRTMEKVRQAKGAVFCVGVGWVLE